MLSHVTVLGISLLAWELGGFVTSKLDRAGSLSRIQGIRRQPLAFPLQHLAQLPAHLFDRAASALHFRHSLGKPYTMAESELSPKFAPFIGMVSAAVGWQ